MEFETVNANPVVHTPSLSRRKALAKSAEDWVDESEERDEMDAEEIFDMVRQIDDPEHPLTLEELQVVTLEQVEVDDARNLVTVRYTPTIPHCSMATLIGLCIRVKLMRSLPPRFKLKVEISPGKHSSEAAGDSLSPSSNICRKLASCHSCPHPPPSWQ
jgi:metal-sulfur cluster biosynthetic enzyme